MGPRLAPLATTAIGSWSSRSIRVTGTYADLLLSQRVDGLVVSGPRADDDELAELVRDGFPIVLQGSRPDLDAPSVDVDNEAGARRRRRAPDRARPPPDRLRHERAARLYRGHRAGDGLPRRARRGGHRLRRPTLSSRAPSTRPAATRRWPSSWPTDRPDGRVRRQRRRRPRCPPRRCATPGCGSPQDVSVVGFDDIALAAHFDPPLTTVRLPAHGLGTAAGQLLVDRVAGRPVPKRTLLPTAARSSANRPPRLSPGRSGGH